MCLTDAEWRAFNIGYGNAVLAAIKRAQMRALHSFPPNQKASQTHSEYRSAVHNWQKKQRDRKELIPRVNTNGKKAKKSTKHSPRSVDACNVSDQT